MSNKSLSIFILFLHLSVCLLASPAQANSDVRANPHAASSQTPIQSTPSSFTLNSFKNEIASPFTEPANQYLYWGTGATLLMLALKHDVEDPFQKSSSERKPLGDFSKIGDLGGQFITNGVYMISMGAHAHFTKSALSERRAMIMLKASAYSGIIANIIKPIARERRPDSSQLSSFPSGHTTVAAAFASVIVCEHGWAPYGYAATALAVLTGYSRINDNRHYLHDVLAGATIGTAFGVGVSSLYPQSEKSVSQTKSSVAKNSSWNLIPIASTNYLGLNGIYEF
jgi:membrane-associated phospholipid phosphatase